MNDANDNNWSNTKSMLRSHGEQWTMNSIGSKAYALGGYRCCGQDYSVSWLEEFNGDTNKWNYKADFPYSIYRHCTAADEETGRLWVTGGTHYYHGTHADGEPYTSNHEKRDTHYYEVSWISKRMA